MSSTTACMSHALDWRVISALTETLATLGIVVPESLINAVYLDQCLNAGNHVVRHLADQPPEVLLAGGLFPPQGDPMSPRGVVPEGRHPVLLSICASQRVCSCLKPSVKMTFGSGCEALCWRTTGFAVLESVLSTEAV